MHPSVKELLIEQMSRRGRCRVRVGGYCMSPAIPHGSMVEVVSAGRLAAGDVAAYFVGTQLFVHRVVEVKEGRVGLRADGTGPDPHEVALAQVLGRVAAVRKPRLLRRLADAVARLLLRVGARIRQATARAPAQATQEQDQPCLTRSGLPCRIGERRLAFLSPPTRETSAAGGAGMDRTPASTELPPSVAHAGAAVASANRR